MNRNQLFFAATVTLFAAATPACVAEPVGSDEPEDAQSEDVGSAEQALSRPGYSLSNNSYFVWGPGTSYDWQVVNCDMYDNGVVRGFQLNELNNRDFRFSRQWCRDMANNGTLGADNDHRDHFFHAGDGTLGISQVPLDKLPVGVRVQAKYILGTFKVSNVALLYSSAADIVAGLNGYTAAPYALTRTDDTYTARCLSGTVLTGIAVNDSTTLLNQDASSAIHGIGLQCTQLVYY